MFKVSYPDYCHMIMHGKFGSPPPVDILQGSPRLCWSIVEALEGGNCFFCTNYNSEIFPTKHDILLRRYLFSIVQTSIAVLEKEHCGILNRI